MVTIYKVKRIARGNPAATMFIYGEPGLSAGNYYPQNIVFRTTDKATAERYRNEMLAAWGREYDYQVVEISHA